MVSDVTLRPTVTASDGIKYSAVVRGADEERDLALLIVPGLKAIPLIFASSVSVGDSAIAIGYAAGLSGEPSVTQGIISGKRVEPDTGLALLQTDAPLNPGNSGGPLLNLRGQVVGVNVARLRGSTVQYENMGFAISIDEILRISDALRAGNIKLLPTPTPSPTPTPTPSGPQSYGPYSLDLSAGYGYQNIPDLEVGNWVLFSFVVAGASVQYGVRDPYGNSAGGNVRYVDRYGNTFWSGGAVPSGEGAFTAATHGDYGIFFFHSGLSSRIVVTVYYTVYPFSW